jgi:hypothetical protein
LLIRESQKFRTFRFSADELSDNSQPVLE